MVIIIGNQKGGAGKSTLTMLLANFLTGQKSCKVIVIDMDYQQSIAQKYQRAKMLDNIAPYEVVAASLEHFPMMYPVLAQNKEQVIIIDLPGKLDDDGLIAVFKSADLVLCPFSYDELSFDSTVLFSVVLQKINPKVNITFIPSRIKANVRYQTKQQVDKQLMSLGQMTEAIPDRIDFQRSNTLRTPESVQPIVKLVFEQIWQKFIALEIGQNETFNNRDAYE